MKLMPICLFSFLLVGTALAGERSEEILLRQPDGTYRGVDAGGRGSYTAQPAYPGADWAPVYDRQGNRVGTIQEQPAGPVFYDQRGSRK
jgi:hypothetical protein